MLPLNEGPVTTDLERAETLPALWYSDPAFYERERRSLFARSWLFVGHDSQLAAPGDYLAEDLVGWPIFVIRGRDGSLRGFHNVCRHRAGPLVWDGEGRCDVLRCRYHGWVYDLDGRLRRAPDFGDAAGFDMADYPLFPVRVESWRGFVFVNLADDAPALETVLAAFAPLAAHLPLESYNAHSRAAHPIACNWKTYAENYLEGYHIPMLHPGLNAEVVAKEYRVAVGDGFVTHHVPTRPERQADAVYDGLWAWLAPNLAFNIYGDGMSVERMMPVGPGRMRLDYTFLFKDLSDAAEAGREAVFAMCRTVTDEDRAICEAVQRNLAAGLYRTGRLSPRHENGVFHFQTMIRDAVAPA